MRRAAILALLVSSAALLGCGEQKAVRAPCPTGEICMEMGLGAEVTSLDPNKITAHWEDQVMGDLLVGLAVSDEHGEPIPGMATHWETSTDGLKWTFHLREARWSDGTPVTSADFVASLQRILKPETASEFASMLYVFKNAQAVNEGKMPPEAVGVKALDARTLEYTLEHPAPYLLLIAKHQTMYPIPAHALKKYGEGRFLEPANFVSNGAYKLLSWKLGDRISVEKNPRFYEAEQVCIDRINYYPTEDRISGERQVLAGALDTNTPLLPNRVAYLRKNHPGWARTDMMLGMTYFAFNMKNPKFQDIRVRKAMSMSIDREWITGTVRAMGEPPAYTFVPKGIANYTSPPDPEWAKWPLEKRIAEAKRLLKEAGYGPGRPLKFEFTFRGYDPTGTYAAMQADWRKLGIEAELIATESQIAYQQLRIRDFEFGDVAWVADYNDPMNFLYLQQSQTGALNYSDYNNPTYDALLAQADNERDLGKRTVILQQAEQIMLDEYKVIPFYQYVSSNITNPRLTGFVGNVDDKHLSRYMCFKK